MCSKRLAANKWKLFLGDAEEAIVASELLFKHGLYGKSAFYAQQCVELSIKSYLLKFHPTEKDFNHHLPLREVVKKLKVDTDLLGRVKSKATNHVIKSLLDKVDIALEDINTKMNSVQKEKHKKYLWECSMGISELNREDFKVLKEFQDMKSSQFEDEIFGLVTDVFRHQLSKRKQNEKEEFKKLLLSTTIKNEIIEEDIKNEIIEIMFSDSQEESIRRIRDFFDRIRNSGRNILDLLFKPNGLLTGIIKHTKTGKVEILTPLELQAIFHMVYVIQHTEISLFPLPHEILGRYSVIIDGKTTKDLYSENKDGLLELIQKSRNVFKQTDSTIKYICTL